MTPTCTEDWVRDALEALREAWHRVDDAVMNPKEDPRPWLFRLAPTLCVQKRNLKGNEVVSELARTTLGKMEDELKMDPEAIENYSINFLLAYFDANAHCGFIEEMEIERAMLYICDHHDFDEEI